MIKKTNNKIILIFLLLIFIYFKKELLIFKKLIKNIFNIIDISIIIPIYNNIKYLPVCLNSVISQTLLNIEIICIDDGSTDKSLNILREYKKKDHRINIIHQKNQGSAIARNKGIKISKGKFIAFMDSDDLYPNKYTLELMFKNAIQKKVLICGGGIRDFIQNNNNKIKLLNILKISFSKNIILKYSNYQYDFYYQRFIYNKNFIKKNKLN